MEDAFDMANLENFFNENFFKKTRVKIENNFEKDQFGGVPESHYEPTFKSVSSSSVRPNLESKGFGSDSWGDSEISSPVQLNFESKNFGSDSWSDSEISAPVQPNFESKNFETDSWSDYDQRSNFESENFGSDSWGDTELPIGPSLESLKEFENLKSRKFVSDSWDDSKIGRTGQQIMERRYDKIEKDDEKITEDIEKVTENVEKISKNEEVSEDSKKILNILDHPETTLRTRVKGNFVIKNCWCFTDLA